MPIYKVQLRRSITEEAYIDIKAADPFEAFEIAMFANDPPDEEWAVTDVLYCHPTGLVKDKHDVIVGSE